MDHVIFRDSGQVTVLDAKQMILYSWDDPQGVRKLLWKPYTGIDKPVEAPVDKVTCLSTMITNTEQFCEGYDVF